MADYKAGRKLGQTLIALAVLSAAPADANTPAGELSELSLEDLGKVEITSVSRRAEPLTRAAASIYVITADDIRRSGATRLAEALRLAPNLQVARVDAHSYAITARGFNNAIGNKLLVLIDGRTVYTPLFSSVFWDSQQVMLADVERIEVISGPGATLWGANAVNGVINVITKSATDTTGVLLAGSAGNDGHGMSARIGGELGSGHYRAFAQRQRIDPTEDAAGTTLADTWDTTHVGFRADWGESDNGFKLQGDAYRGESATRPFGPIEVSGMNLLARWRRQLEAGSTLRVQVYYDRAERDNPIQFHDRMQIADLEIQHGFPVGARHSVLWGGGYRIAHDRAEPGLLVAFLPPRKDLHWANLFVQDQFAVNEALDLSFGLKLEHNDYTGLEVLPSVRVAWRPAAGLLWGSLSRAVRTPSRIDREFFLPSVPPYLIRGGPDFVSEVSNVAELGFRAEPTAALSYSLTLFHHEHDRLRSGEPAEGGGYQVENGIEGSTSGLEAWGAVQITPAWRLTGGIVRLHQSLRLKPGSLDPAGTTAQGNDPDFQWQLRSTYTLDARQEFTLSVRGVDDLPAPVIEGYTSVDIGYAWRPMPDLELRLIVQDVFDSERTEFEPGLLAPPSVFGRGASLNVVVTW